MNTCLWNTLQMLKNLVHNLKKTYMLAAVPNLLQTRYFPAQNMKHSDRLPTPVQAKFQNHLDHGSSWKHGCYPPLPFHLQTTVLRMMNSFLTREGKVLNANP